MGVFEALLLNSSSTLNTASENVYKVEKNMVRFRKSTHNLNWCLIFKVIFN